MSFRTGSCKVSEGCGRCFAKADSWERGHAFDSCEQSRTLAPITLHRPGARLYTHRWRDQQVQHGTFVGCVFLQSDSKSCRLTRKVLALEAEHVTRGLRVQQQSTGAFVVMIRSCVLQLPEGRVGSRYMLTTRRGMHVA